MGGFTGTIEEGAIYDCYSECDMTGISEVGGLVGYCMASAMINCYATGAVTATGDNVGGLIGLSSVYEMENCCATGDVVGENDVGGLIGSSEQTTFLQSFAKGTVSGADNIGGFIGNAERIKIDNCYARGNVSGTNNIGAFAGRFIRQYGYAYILNSYATGNGANGELFGHIDEDILTASCTYENQIQMLSANKATALKIDNELWLEDNNINNNYPVLDWQINGYSLVPEITMTAMSVNSVGNEIPLTDKSIYDGVECSLYLYYNDIFNPAILRADKPLVIESDIKSSVGNKNFMLTFALYNTESKKPVMLKTTNDNIGATKTPLTISLTSQDFSAFGDISDYHAKIFVWETQTLKPVIEFERLNSMQNIGNSYSLSNNTQATQSYGLINFIPQSDGYYDIRTTGENIEIGGVLYHQDPLYNTSESLIGQELLRIPSTAGVSIHNKDTYELKAGIEYSLKLENMSGNGDYDVTIEKIETMQDIYVQHNEPVMPLNGSQTIFTPIKWVGDEVVETTENDPDWYDYRVSQNKWANVKLQDGSMFVWVPRYAYRIIQDSNPINKYSNQIEVKYLNGLTNIAYDGTVCKTADQNPSDTDFIVHSGFTHGGVTYSGLCLNK